MGRFSAGRYQDFLNSDSGCSFHEWLGIRRPEIQMSLIYPCNGLYRMTNWVRAGLFNRKFIAGEYCKTKKEAKASYKLALAKHRKEMREFYG